MEGITCPEQLECTLKFLDTTLDGGLVEKISDWEPVAHPVPDATPDGRPMERTTIPEPLEHSVLVESLDSGHTEGMLSLEPFEQSMLNTLLVTRPMEGSTETNPPELWIGLVPMWDQVWTVVCAFRILTVRNRMWTFVLIQTRAPWRGWNGTLGMKHVS